MTAPNVPGGTDNGGGNNAIINTRVVAVRPANAAQPAGAVAFDADKVRDIARRIGTGDAAADRPAALQNFPTFTNSPISELVLAYSVIPETVDAVVSFLYYMAQSVAKVPAVLNTYADNGQTLDNTHSTALTSALVNLDIQTRSNRGATR